MTTSTTDQIVGTQDTLGTDEFLRLHTLMIRVRHFELAGAKALSLGLLSGTLHLSVGQEAIAAGVCGRLRSTDLITSTHRGHGHCLAKGAAPKRMMAELFGAAAGYCKGRSGSMHIADSAVGILGANGIVGGGLGMATGAALSAQVKDTDQVTVAFFGEGAAGEGALHEAMNLAALWKLPVVFVCENNNYAELSPMSSVLAVEHVADLAAPFGIPASTVDGNDLPTVVRACDEAVDRARRGEGPTLIEYVTYRQSGHYEGDAQTYRTKEERAEWALRDPLALSRRALIGRGIAESVLDAIEEGAVAEMAEAVSWSQLQPLAPAVSMLDDIYAAEGN